MFKNKKFLCVAAIFVAAAIGLTVYAAFANPSVASMIMPMGLTKVGWSASPAPDEASAAEDSNVSPASKNATCPLEDVVCTKAETCDSSAVCDTSTSSAEPCLGVKVGPIHESLYRHVPGLAGQKHGVMVDDVMKDSPAMEAGLGKFDLLTHYNGTAIQSPQALAKLVKSSSIDEEVELTYLRNGQQAKVNVALKPMDRTTRAKIAGSPWVVPWGNFWLGSNWPLTTWQDDDLINNFDVNIDSAPTSWSESQSMKMTRDQDGNYDIKIEYRKNGDRVERTFSGTRDEVLTAIDDSDLSDTVKQRLKSSLSEEKIQPAEFANDAFKKMKKRFDQSFLDEDLFSHDVFDRWFDNDWLIDDWFEKPSLLQSDVFSEFGVSTDNSGNEKSNQEK